MHPQPPHPVVTQRWQQEACVGRLTVPGRDLPFRPQCLQSVIKEKPHLSPRATRKQRPSFEVEAPAWLSLEPRCLETVRRPAGAGELR